MMLLPPPGRPYSHRILRPVHKKGRVFGREKDKGRKRFLRSFFEEYPCFEKKRGDVHNLLRWE